MTIGVLYHEKEKELQHLYYIDHFIRVWRMHGHKVLKLYGTHQIEENPDLIIVHLDLTIIPDEYVEFYSRFDNVMNRHVLDIRKSNVCTHLVSKEDQYIGPVLVKTELNYAGIPELVFLERPLKHIPEPFPFREISKVRNKLLKKSPYLKRFRIFRNKSLVPDSIWNSPNFIVQQYLPEKIGKLYRIRQAYFLGNRIYGIDVKSQNPIVKSNNLTSSDPIPVPKEIIYFRNEIQLDYGKIDFTIHNAELVVLDVTKTIGFDDRSDVIEVLHSGIDNPISYH